MKELLDFSDKELILERNHFLKIKGSIDTNLYYIISGSLKVFIIEDINEQIVRFGYKNNIIVALDSYLTGKPSVYYIQAIKKTRIKVITKSEVDKFLKNENNRYLWNNILEDLILQQLEREIDLLTNSPKDRYLRVLQRSPQLFQEIPLRYIANYLRMSAETLSRLRKS